MRRRLLHILPIRGLNGERNRAKTLGAALTMALVVAVGCGTPPQPTPASPPAGEATTPAATAVATTAGETPAATAGSTASPVAASETAAPSGSSFMDIIAESMNASYKVTYQVTGNSGGQEMTGEQTWYVKPPKMRMDMAIADLGAAGSSSMFVLDDGSYVCTAATGTTTCMRLPAEASSQQNPAAELQSELQAQADQVKAVNQGTRVIAGQEAQCYSVTSEADPDAVFTEALTCYSAEGVPLLLDTKGPEMQITMEATSFDTTVSDADFELPAEPIDMPMAPGMLPGGIPGGMPGAGS